MKKYKVCFLVILLLFIYTFLCAISYAKSTSIGISQNVFRLHVIANSDSKEDQDLKYKVRDSLLNYMNSLTSNCSSKEEAISIANDNIDNFQKIALKTIKDNGYNYNISVEIGNFSFPTKTYGDITLPSGNYDALRVKIGEAKGQNWWCVMFPPLCFIDISSGIVPEESKNSLKDSMTEEEYSLISNQKDNNLKFKFKLLELFANTDLISMKK